MRDGPLLVLALNYRSANYWAKQLNLGVVDKHWIWVKDHVTHLRGTRDGRYVTTLGWHELSGYTTSRVQAELRAMGYTQDAELQSLYLAKDTPRE